MSALKLSKALSLTLIMLVSVLAGCIGGEGELNSTDLFDLVDGDGDGVLDNIDDCPSTPADKKVNATGCEKGADDEELPLPTERAPQVNIGSDGDQTITCDRDDDGVHAPDIVMMSGLMDNYNGATVDPHPNPSTALDSWQNQLPGYMGSLPGSSYDDPNLGQIVLHTFQLPSGIITDATLEMRLNYLDDGLPQPSGFALTDTIMLRFEGSTPAPWSMHIDTSMNSPTAPWPDAIYFMHLDTLPSAGMIAAQGVAGNTNLVQSMNSAGFLDIVVYDHQQVDYFELALCIEEAPPSHTDITLGKNYDCENRFNPDPDLAPHTTYTDYVMTAGVNDIFAAAPPSENPSPSAALTSQHNSQFPGFSPVNDYDVMNPGAHFLETFDWSTYVQTQASTNNFLSYQLVDAVLEFQMRGRSPQSSADDVFVMTHVTNPVSAPDWWANIGASSINSVSSAGTQYTLYLSSMPASGGSFDALNGVPGNTNMLPGMDSSDSLDVKIYDDQELDYLELHLCFEEVLDTWTPPPVERWNTSGNYSCNATSSNSTYETSYEAGSNDNYNQIQVDPLVYQSPSLMNWGGSMMWNSQQLGLNPITNFLEFDEDSANDDGILSYTFTNLPSDATQGGMMILDAKLRVNFKHGSSHNYADDIITLRFEDPTHQTTPWSAQIYTSSSAPSASGYSAILHLDELPASGTTSLEAMASPGANPGNVYLLGAMNALSILDVTIQDGIIVDSMELIVCSEDITVGNNGFADVCDLGTTNQVIEVYTAGLQDNFDQQIPDPSMAYSPSQLEYMQWSQSQGSNTWQASQVGNFDNPSNDKWVMHQFTGLPNDILQANLEIGMKDTGSATNTDSIILSWFETDDGTASGNWLGGNQNGVVSSDIWNNPSGQYSSQLVNYQFSSLTAATTGPGYILNLDMGRMHQAGTVFSNAGDLDNGPYSLIDELNSKSYFEVLIQDDQQVDFIRLTICRDKMAEADSDGDGISDAEEGYTLDTDGDNVPNYLDIDSDGDNIHDGTEWFDQNGAGSANTDGDNDLDYLDTDSDGDGLDDDVESVADVDGDGDGNWRDTDSDGDGTSDYDEWTNNTDPYVP